MSELSSLRRRTPRQRRTDRKIHAAVAKRELGEELTEYEWMIVQYALGGGCHVRGASGVMVGARLTGRGRPKFPKEIPRAG